MPTGSLMLDLIFLNLSNIFLNHGAINGTGSPMTLGRSGNNTTSPLPTESFFSIIEMFNSILCFILNNCIEYGNT